MEKKKSSVVETTTLQKVSPEEKKSWWSIAFIWMGSVICVPALMVGGMISSGLPFGQTVLAMVLGFGLVVVYMSLLGAQSSDLGVPSTVSFSRAFGSRGSGVAVGAIIAIMGTGWFAYQTHVCASSFCMIIAEYLGFEFPFWLSCLLWGGAMFVTAVYGIKLIDILNKISVPALLIFLVYGVVVALSKPGASAALGSYEPAAAMPFTVALTYAVSGFAVGAVISGDYIRYCRSRKDAAISSIVGVLPAGVGVLVIGAILAITAGNYDITIMFSSMGQPIIGLLVLILATWTTNTGNAYSAGIAVVNIFKLKDDKRAPATLICGAVGTILAIAGVINVFTSFLNLISALLPPIAGVVIADYWIKGRGKANLWKPWPGVNWIGILSWLCGSAFALIFTNLFVPSINGIVLSMVLYLILINVVKSPKLNPFAAENYSMPVPEGVPLAKEAN